MSNVVPLRTRVMIPDGLRMAAIREGVPAAQVDALWAKHLAWCDANSTQEYGGPVWKALCAKVAKDGPGLPTIARTDPEVIAARKRDGEAALLEEQAYQRGAVSLREWLDELRVKPDFSETLSPHEEKLVKFREPQPGEEPGAWLLAALKPGRRQRP